MGLISTVIGALRNKILMRLVENSIAAIRNVPNQDELLNIFCQDFAERGYMICSLPDDDTDPLAAVFVWRRADYESPSLQQRLEEMRRQGFKITVGLKE